MVSDWKDEDEITAYLTKILNKRRLINQGLFTVSVTPFIRYPIPVPRL